MKNPLLVFLLVSLVPSAQAQLWVKIDTMFNTSGVAVQNFSAPVFADLNRDGTADLLLGNGSSTRVAFFKRLGSGVPPRFMPDTAMLSSIYAGGMMGTNSDYPQVVDLNGDGRLDVVVGGYNGLLHYLNTGDTLQPAWQRIDTVFSGVNVLIGTDAKPTFGDLDGDGDQDLLIGIGESLFGGPTPGITMGFRNTGSRTRPQYALDSTLVVGIPDVGLNSYPVLKDLDNDGDPDLLIGRDLQGFAYFQNTGGPFSPTWTASNGTFAGIGASTYWNSPTLFDLDRDGDFDLVYGTSDGTLFYYENIGTPAAPQFQFNANYFSVVRISGNASTVSLADFDGDGDLDFVSGDWLGRFQYFRNDGTRFAPRFNKATASFSSLDAGSYSSPVFVDIDGDLDLDIVSGALDGMIYCYINTGTGFMQNTTMFAGIDVGYRSAPALVDIDNDGDSDMLVGAEDASAMAFYRNHGGNVFVLDNSLLAGVTSVRDAHPTFVDLDRDGDYDLIVGGGFGSVMYYENVGTRTNPAWNRNDAALAGIAVRQDAAAGCVDLDGDEKPDMIVGEYNGNFTYYKNMRPNAVDEQNIQPAEFALFQNFPNPFNPSTEIRFSIPEIGTRSRPPLADGQIADYGLVILTVYDVLGREVTTLVNEVKQPGTYTVQWQAPRLSTGVYFCRMQTRNYFETIKMALIR